MDEKRFRSELEFLVNLDCGEDSPQGIISCADFFVSRFQHLGWRADKVDVGAIAPALVAYNNDSVKYDFLLAGHMDTVFSKGTAARRPYEEKWPFAYGPGVCDMKSGCLAILHALEDVSPEVLANRNIVVFLQPDEETGSPHSRSLLMDVASKSAACLVAEAADSESGAHCIQRKGICKFGFEFRGIAGHAGNMLENGSRSAIVEMAHWIASISDLTNPAANITANVGLVSGGTATNVVADSASLSGEIRFENPQDVDGIMESFEKLESHASAAGIQANQTYRRLESPMFPSRETIDFISKLERRGIKFPVHKRGGLSAANFIAPLVPVCIDGLGPAGGMAHGEEEFVRLDDLSPSVNLLISMIEEGV